MSTFIRRLVVLPIRAYQLFISPLLPKSCVFEPSCSEYTKQSIMKYGPVRGILMGLGRISRCHPWQKQHYDPVP